MVRLRSGNSDCCCMPKECCGSTNSAKKVLLSIGYNGNQLQSILDSSKLGAGCGAPLEFANLKAGEMVVDLGSGAGIDVFLASRTVKEAGKVIGIDFTDDMLHKAREAAKEYGFKNVEFRKGDIEIKIPVEENSVDIVISNCLIYLTSDKISAFKEAYRILKKDGKGRIIISDLVTSKEVHGESVNAEGWCSCIDGALTKENYVNSIKQAGFRDVMILSEQTYLSEDKTDGRKLTSIIVGAVTK